MSAQKGYILPLVLFGTVAVLSGIGLLVYMFFYKPSQQQVALTPLPTPNYTATPSLVTDFESCAKAGNVIMESYPRKCNANGKSFTEVIATSSSTLQQSKTYQDTEISFNYPGFFEGGEASSSADEIVLNGSQLIKTLAFGTGSNDNGFQMRIISNDRNLSVADWWALQFSSGSTFALYGHQFSINDLNLNSGKIGQYDISSLNFDAQGRYMFFAYKNRIILFSTTSEDESIIGSIK